MTVIFQQKLGSQIDVLKEAELANLFLLSSVNLFKILKGFFIFINFI